MMKWIFWSSVAVGGLVVLGRYKQRKAALAVQPTGGELGEELGELGELDETSLVRTLQTTLREGATEAEERFFDAVDPATSGGDQFFNTGREPEATSSTSSGGCGGSS